MRCFIIIITNFNFLQFNIFYFFFYNKIFILRKHAKKKVKIFFIKIYKYVLCTLMQKNILNVYQEISINFM